MHQDDSVMNIMLQLFALIAKQPAFHQLRTVEQLGYITSLALRYVKTFVSLELISLHKLVIFSKSSTLLFHIHLGTSLVYMECNLLFNPLSRSDNNFYPLLNREEKVFCGLTVKHSSLKFTGTQAS